MKLNKIQFSKLKLQWEIRKYAAGVLHGDEAIGEILSSKEDMNELDSLRMLINKGYDFLPKEDLQSSKEFKSLLEDSKENKYSQYLEDALTSSKSEIDMFGNVRKWSDKEIIQEQMKELEELGRKLLKEEKYEEMREAQEIWEKLKKELNKLN